MGERDKPGLVRVRVGESIDIATTREKHPKNPAVAWIYVYATGCSQTNSALVTMPISEALPNRDPMRKYRKHTAYVEDLVGGALICTIYQQWES